MTKWKIVFSGQAECDLRNIYEYIAFSLLESVVAKKQVSRLIKGIRALSAYPMRCPVFDAEPWNRIGMRTLLIDSYSVLFLPNEDGSTVSIARIMYSGRDIETELAKQLPLGS